MDNRNDDAPTIDPEFASLLVPLTAQEEALLAESIRRVGCKEPLTVWKGHGVLLDGHARFRIARANGIPFAVAEVELPDREAARRWVWQRQAGRRNLRPVAAAYTRGLMYRSLQKRPGARTDLAAGPKARRWASADVATLFGVDESTVRRDSRFARDLEKIAAKLGEEFKREVLTGGSRLSRQMAHTLAGMSRSENGRFKMQQHLRKLEREKEEARAARRKSKTPTSPAVEPSVREAQAHEHEAASPITAATALHDEDAIDHRRDDLADAPAGRDEPAPVEEQVDEALVDQLSELFHRANHATRLEFLGGPLVRAALRRLATQALSA